MSKAYNLVLETHQYPFFIRADKKSQKIRVIIDFFFNRKTLQKPKIFIIYKKFKGCCDPISIKGVFGDTSNPSAFVKIIIIFHKKFS